MTPPGQSGKYLEIEHFGFSESGKTSFFQVLTKDRTTRLGMVSWYAPWRKYVFESSGGMVYDANCLREIADFTERTTKEHRDGRHNQQQDRFSV